MTIVFESSQLFRNSATKEMESCLAEKGVTYTDTIENMNIERIPSVPSVLPSLQQLPRYLGE